MHIPSSSISSNNKNSKEYNHFFFIFMRGNCLDFSSQKVICRAAACSLNFLPHVLHCTIPWATYAACFSSFETYIPFACFKLARNAKLAAFHFGIVYPYFLMLLWTCTCFLAIFEDSVFLFWGTESYSTYGALWAAESKAFLFCWNTFTQFFSCLAITLALNVL